MARDCGIALAMSLRLIAIRSTGYSWRRRSTRTSRLSRLTPCSRSTESIACGEEGTFVPTGSSRSGRCRHGHRPETDATSLPSCMRVAGIPHRQEYSKTYNGLQRRFARRHRLRRGCWSCRARPYPQRAVVPPQYSQRQRPIGPASPVFGAGFRAGQARSPLPPLCPRRRWGRWRAQHAFGIGQIDSTMADGFEDAVSLTVRPENCRGASANRPFASVVNSIKPKSPYGPSTRSTTVTLAPGNGRLPCSVASKTTPVNGPVGAGGDGDDGGGVGTVGGWLQLVTIAARESATSRVSRAARRIRLTGAPSPMKRQPLENRTRSRALTATARTDGSSRSTRRSPAGQ